MSVMTAKPFPAETPASRTVAQSGPDFSSLRQKITVVTSRIKDAWSAIAADSNEADLHDLRALIAMHDDLLMDLQEQQILIAADATIQVNLKRKRSPSPCMNRKRRLDEEQTTHPKPIIGEAKAQDHAVELFQESSTTVADRCKHAKLTNHFNQPKPGEIYLAFRQQSQCWLAALLLPNDDLRTVGISGTIESLGLSKNVPHCHVYNVDSGRLEWQDGYEDGGPYSHKRKYPIVYFINTINTRFPDSGATDWVTAGELRVLDETRLQPSLLPYYSVVRAFIERRAGSRTLESRMADPLPACDEQSGNGHTSACPNDQKRLSKIDFSKARHPAERKRDKSQSVLLPSTRSQTFSTGAFGIRGSPSPPRPKLPRPRPTYGDAGVDRSSLPYAPTLSSTYRLPPIDHKRQQLDSITLPRLNLHIKDMNYYGTRLGLFEWPEDLPQRIINCLARESKVKGVDPLPKDFCTSLNLLRCPLCKDKIKEFVLLKRFTDHLRNNH